MTEALTYLDTNQLAKRYGVQSNTIKIWRHKSKKENRQIGPPWYEIPKLAASSKTLRVRYNLDQVIAWEKENNIIPKEES